MNDLRGGSGPGPSAATGRGPVLAAVLGAACVVAVGVVAALVAARLGAVGEAERLARLPVLPSAAAATARPLADVAEEARSRVVAIEVETDRGERFGTGWLVDDAGSFVTNDHVVERARALRLVDRAGHVHAAVVTGTDAGQDVAVVRSLDGFAARPIPVEPATVAIGDRVALLAAARSTQHPDLTVETVRRLHDSITVDPEHAQAGGGGVVYEDMLVLHGAAVFEGNSGGPVLDGLGRVRAIVTATSPTLPEAYAIPVGRVIAEVRTFAARALPTP